MAKKLKFLLIDDDAVCLEAVSAILTQAGHQVVKANSPEYALETVTAFQPDCIISDLLMPKLDGVAVFNKVRKMAIKQPVFIIITIKAYRFDRRQALLRGVDGYLNKPIQFDTFLEDVLAIINKTMTIQFWGVRGSLPIPGRKSILYGGNTNCVSLTYGDRLFIFDGGTGIKELANELNREEKSPISATIFITHSHYDHIHGLPFFEPFYKLGNEFEILGACQGDLSFEQVINGQMEGPYFPITMRETAAKINFREIAEEQFTIDDLTVETILLNHPGNCLGFKLSDGQCTFCYITDNELFMKDSPHYNDDDEQKLINFVKHANALVIDVTYFDEEYRTRVGWGHSCVSRVIDIVIAAKVKKLFLYHHDPSQSDADIRRKLKVAQSMLKKLGSKTICIAPKEGEKFKIS